MPAPTHSRARHFGNLHRSFEGRSSRVYDVVARRLLRELYRRIAEDVALVAPADGSVLDVGTGPGVLLGEIASRRRDLRVYGIDLAADMAAAAERNVRSFGERVSVHVGDVAELPFGDGAFDVVVSSFSLHHWADVRGAAPELARVLRPGGRLVIYDFQRAPFEVFDAAARELSVFNTVPAQQNLIRTGRLHLRTSVRYVRSKTDARCDPVAKHTP